MVQLLKELKGNPCHLYLDKRFPHIDYAPVSTVKKTYEFPFDPKQAAKSSKNERSKWFGMDPKEIALEWEIMADEGKALGTFVHKTIETFLGDEVAYQRMSAKEKTLCDAFRIYIDNYRMRENKVFSEYTLSMNICNKDTSLTTAVIDRMDKEELINRMLASPNFPFTERYFINMNEATVRECAKSVLIDRGLAGTADLIIKYPKYFMIHDIKVDKSIDKYNRFEKTMMLPPLENLEYCNFEVYCLQIWMYALMAEKEFGLPFGGGMIIHWLRKHQRFTVIPIANRRQEARQMLAHFFGIGPYRKAA